jgi:hypothetical protein
MTWFMPAEQLLHDSSAGCVAPMIFVPGIQ